MGQQKRNIKEFSLNIALNNKQSHKKESHSCPFYYYHHLFLLLILLHIWANVWQDYNLINHCIQCYISIPHISTPRGYFKFYNTCHLNNHIKYTIYLTITHSNCATTMIYICIYLLSEQLTPFKTRLNTALCNMSITLGSRIITSFLYFTTNLLLNKKL